MTLQIDYETDREIGIEYEEPGKKSSAEGSGYGRLSL